MKKEKIVEGYDLMMEYMSEQRIKTKNRNFINRLQRYYNKNILNNDDVEVDNGVEMQYLRFAREFYTTIALPTTNEEKALVEVLNIICKTDDS